MDGQTTVAVTPGTWLYIVDGQVACPAGSVCPGLIYFANDTTPTLLDSVSETAYASSRASMAKTGVVSLTVPSQLHLYFSAGSATGRSGSASVRLIRLAEPPA